MRLWIILIDWFLEDKRVCMWFECSTKIYFNSNLLGALVGLDRGSKYCTIRVRESEYALATATPTEASTMKSAADAAVLPGFERWWCDDSRYMVCCFDEGVCARSQFYIHVGIFRIWRSFTCTRVERSMCVDVWRFEKSRIQNSWKEIEREKREISNN